MHRVFICYHHANDQPYKDALATFGIDQGIFEDWSVATDDIDDTLDDETIRQRIRDDYLRDSAVTIVLVGTETKYRKHVDWEIYSTMRDGAVNKKSEILVITLPTIAGDFPHAAHGELEKRTIYPHLANWTSIDRAEYERRYPLLPDRLIDNLAAPSGKISVIAWNLLDAEKLRLLVELTFADRHECIYDLSRPLKRANTAAPR